ncbi:unnamed protein product, partial [Musa acuminata subsp. burmannicoides]
QSTVDREQLDCRVGASVLPRSTLYILGEFGHPCFHVVIRATTVRKMKMQGTVHVRMRVRGDLKGKCK